MLSGTVKSKNMVLDEDEDEDDASENVSMSSSSYAGTSMSKSGHEEAKQDEAEKKLRDKIIKNEEKAVRKARVIVIAAFISCATAVSVAVYKFASRADYRSFEQEVRKGLSYGFCVYQYIKHQQPSLTHSRSNCSKHG